jgi:two-component system cell cycle sensor histidine kinase/response regulator CckA
MVLADIGPGGRNYEDIKQIQRAGERAAALTRQLLAFSRQHAVHTQIIIPGQIVLEIQPMLARLLGEDVDLFVVAPEPFGRVLADATQIEQMVMNLALNARDAMPRGGRLGIELQNVEIDEAGARLGLSLYFVGEA